MGKPAKTIRMTINFELRESYHIIQWLLAAINSPSSLFGSQLPMMTAGYLVIECSLSTAAGLLKNTNLHGRISSRYSSSPTMRSAESGSPPTL
uniref:Uncharacterized protein n=1 Tax=Nelumbo nucifera TaxID=4432 RepID=A0A822YS49_NELNU|nr:TPA_asm: hypothetical protein HUJ06_007635 [Nelumbo nucifera]